MSIKNYLIMLSIACISANCYCMEDNIKQDKIINNNGSGFVTINDGSAPKPQEAQASLQNYDIDYYKNENNNLNNKIESLTKNVEQIKIEYHNALKGYDITMKENIEQNIKIKSLLKTIEEMQNNNTEKDTEIKSLSKTIEEMQYNNKEKDTEIKSLSKTIKEMKSNNKDVTDQNIKQQDEIKSLLETIEEMKNNNKDITDQNTKQQDEIKSLLKTIEEIKDHNNATAQYNTEVINFAINNHLDNMKEFLSKNEICFTCNNNLKNRDAGSWFKYRKDNQQTVCLRYQKTVESNCNSYSNCSTKKLQENNKNLLHNMKKDMEQSKQDCIEKLDNIMFNRISPQVDFTENIDSDIEYFTKQKKYLNKLLENLQFWNNINTGKNNPMLKYKGDIISYVNDYLDPIIQDLSEVREIPKNIKLDKSIIKINKYRENIKLEMQNMLDNVNINYEDSINLMNNVCNRLKDIFIQEGNIKNAINEINKFTSSDKRKELFKKSITKEKDITSNNKSLEKSQKKVMQSNKFAKYEHLFGNAS